MKNTRKPSSFRFLLVLSALVAVVALITACSDSKDPETTTDAATTTEAPATTTEPSVVTTTETPAVTTTKAPVTTTETPAVTTTKTPVTTTETPVVTTTKPAATTTKPATTTTKPAATTTKPATTTSTPTVPETPDMTEYTVIFLDHEGKELGRVTGIYGDPITAPKAPDRGEDYVFVGWSDNVSIITDNITVTPIYKAKTFNVTFVDYDGKEIAKQEVEKGKSATAPANPTREHYTFTGWDIKFDNVTSDLTVKAQYKINTYTVTFIGFNGVELSKQTVNSGEAATAPEAPAIETYEFLGWNTSFNCVTSNLTVKAQYKQITYTVTFVDFDGREISRQTVIVGNSANAPTTPDREHYTFTGWDIKFDNVRSDLTITAQYKMNTYTVIFYGIDGNELSRQTVNSGEAATAPEAPTIAGYKFNGWSGDFDYVTSDLEITAEYKEIKPAFIVESSTVAAGDTVTVSVYVENNPGILGTQFGIEWDESVFTLESQSASDGIFADLTYTRPSQLKSGCSFLWYGSNIGEVEDGVILTLTFKAADNAEKGGYEITIVEYPSSTYDSEYNPVNMSYENGIITVE